MSMTDDVCEYDDYVNHMRREVIMAAVFSWTGKVGITFGVLCSGFVLTWSGFRQELGAAQLPETITHMRLLFAGGTGLGLIVCTIFLLFYPLQEKEVNHIKAELAKRKGDAAADYTLSGMRCHKSFIFAIAAWFCYPVRYQR